jgi:uncharacterized Fe-S radical SAM superfamily protein PflX
VTKLYDCSEYEDIETLKLLEGTVDNMYLPDVRCSGNETVFKSGIKNYYIEINQVALKEMKM